jgi:hypothetical protein
LHHLILPYRQSKMLFAVKRTRENFSVQLLNVGVAEN